MSFKPIECPTCHAMLRSKYEIRSEAGGIKRWRWLRWCPACGTPLKVVFGKPWNCVEGAEIDGDRTRKKRLVADMLRKCRGGWSSGSCYYTIINALGAPDTSREDGGHALYSVIADLIDPDGCDHYEHSDR